MPFNTYTFICFFAIVLIVHTLLRNWRAQKINLLIASYLFYSAWNPVFVLLLIFSTVADWVIANKIHYAKESWEKKRFLIFSLVINLGLLAYFKYGNFFLENFAELINAAGVNYQPAKADIILPVGISFYTFQTLSYTIDVYRGKISPSKSLTDYALYVAFFPQLVAGPIVRASDFLPQCETPRRASQDQLGWGLALLTMGLFIKIIFADAIFAPVVDKVYENPQQFGKVETWAAIFAFSGQIFCDFSGYSTCAIGAALCLGFILPDNFKAPYAALGFRDFWHRWHISLSTWLRDYLYISLGGNRVSSARTQLNIIMTMLIGGLWHGASWLFIMWGGLHGLYLVIENILRRFVKVQIKGVIEIALIVLTFLIVSLTWVFFRAENFKDAIQIFNNLILSNSTKELTLSGEELGLSLLASFILVTWHILIRNDSIEVFYKNISPYSRGLLLTSQLLIIYLFASGDDRAFIYFQF